MAQSDLFRFYYHCRSADATGQCDALLLAFSPLAYGGHSQPLFAADCALLCFRAQEVRIAGGE